MIGSMAALHISEAELARNLHAVLEQVRQGSEVVVEQDHRPVAIIKPAEQSGRLLSESIGSPGSGRRNVARPSSSIRTLPKISKTSCATGGSGIRRPGTNTRYRILVTAEGRRHSVADILEQTRLPSAPE